MGAVDSLLGLLECNLCMMPSVSQEKPFVYEISEERRRYPQSRSDGRELVEFKEIPYRAFRVKSDEESLPFLLRFRGHNPSPEISLYCNPVDGLPSGRLLDLRNQALELNRADAAAEEHLHPFDLVPVVAPGRPADRAPPLVAELHLYPPLRDKPRKPGFELHRSLESRGEVPVEGIYGPEHSELDVLDDPNAWRELLDER